jgi:hypothetical protein
VLSVLACVMSILLGLISSCGVLESILLLAVWIGFGPCGSASAGRSWESPHGPGDSRRSAVEPLASSAREMTGDHVRWRLPGRRPRIPLARPGPPRLREGT